MQFLLAHAPYIHTCPTKHSHANPKIDFRWPRGQYLDFQIARLDLSTVQLGIGIPDPRFGAAPRGQRRPRQQSTSRQSTGGSSVPRCKLCLAAPSVRVHHRVRAIALATVCPLTPLSSTLA
jgi:hypothetical protein